MEKEMQNKDREIVVEMASSINGVIATVEGNEDFLSYRGWEIMLEFLKEYDCLVWGRKTFESVASWGEEYVNDLKDINIIVMSSNYVNDTELKNVYVCKSVDDCLTLCEKMNFNKIFISGGARTNNEFLVKGVVDKLIVNYNPYVINKGIGLYDGEFFESKLQLIKVVEEQDGIVQIHYKVVK